MSTKHEGIARNLSPEARRALIDAQISQPADRYELPDLTSSEAMDELERAVLIHGRFLTVRGEAVRYYVIEQETAL